MFENCCKSKGLQFLQSGPRTAVLPALSGLAAPWAELDVFLLESGSSGGELDSFCAILTPICLNVLRSCFSFTNSVVKAAAHACLVTHVNLLPLYQRPVPKPSVHFCSYLFLKLCTNKFHLVFIRSCPQLAELVFSSDFITLCLVI